MGKKFRNAIIVTIGVEETIKLHEFLGDTEFRDTFKIPHGRDKRIYKPKWFWVYNEGELSGSSGAKCEEKTDKRFPSFPKFTLKGYIKYNKYPILKWLYNQK